jgi:ParB-like chromosome segregation protein Spo0J
MRVHFRSADRDGSAQQRTEGSKTPVPHHHEGDGTMTVVEQVSFADLYIHPLNPRLDPPQAEIDALATNIRELGLIQNLAGLRDEAGKVGVIAGGRRLRALEQLQDDDRFALVPVKLAEDEATVAF